MVIAVLVVAANTVAASVVLNTRAVLENTRRQLEPRSAVGPAGKGGVTRLFRGWLQLPLGWKLAEVVAFVWLSASAAITFNTAAAGDPLPAPLRALDALLSLVASIVIAAVTIKIWRLGRRPLEA